MRALTTLFLLVAAYAILPAQDCQLAVMQVNIPEGVTKHHFPVQEMPMAFSADHFVYGVNWDQGDLTIRIRFSEDGDTGQIGRYSSAISVILLQRLLPSIFLSNNTSILSGRFIIKRVKLVS